MGPAPGFGAAFLQYTFMGIFADIFGDKAAGAATAKGGTAIKKGLREWPGSIGVVVYALILLGTETVPELAGK